MAAQMGRQERLERADIVIDNSRPLAELDEVVRQLHQDLLRRAATTA